MYILLGTGGEITPSSAQQPIVGEERRKQLGNSLGSGSMVLERKGGDGPRGRQRSLCHKANHSTPRNAPAVRMKTLVAKVRASAAEDWRAARLSSWRTLTHPPYLLRKRFASSNSIWEIFRGECRFRDNPARFLPCLSSAKANATADFPLQGQYIKAFLLGKQISQNRRGKAVGINNSASVIKI